MKWKLIVIILVLAVLAGGVAALTFVAAPEKTTIKVFFGNRQTDPGSLDCGRVYPAERATPKIEAVARAALAELLAGPTEAEQAQGFFTAINSGVTLRSLAIENGVAKADFSSRLGEGVGGSCLVAAIRSQISETLKQFPTVDSVVISIDGQVDDILQP